MSKNSPHQAERAWCVKWSVKVVWELSYKPNAVNTTRYSWRCTNKLFINPDKSKLILFRMRQLLSGVPDIRVPFLGQHLIPVSSVKDLGIVLDSNLTFNEHVNTLTSSLISTLWQISRARHLFSKSVLTIILNCIVFCKLFYCSTVWSGTFAHNINKLQLVQNFAARVLTNSKKFDHISPVL